MSFHVPRPRRAGRLLSAFGGLLLLAVGAVALPGEARGQRMPEMRSAPAGDQAPAEMAHAPKREDAPQREAASACGGSPLTTLLPLMLMGAVFAGLFFGIRWLLNRSRPDPLVPYVQQLQVQLAADDLDARVDAINRLGRVAWDQPGWLPHIRHQLTGFVEAGAASLDEDTPKDQLPVDLRAAREILDAMQK